MEAHIELLLLPDLCHHLSISNYSSRARVSMICFCRVNSRSSPAAAQVNHIDAGHGSSILTLLSSFVGSSDRCQKTKQE